MQQLQDQLRLPPGPGRRRLPRGPQQHAGHRREPGRLPFQRQAAGGHQRQGLGTLPPRCAPSASHNLFIISNGDPENTPGSSEFLYVYGNHWAPPAPTSLTTSLQRAGPKALSMQLKITERSWGDCPATYAHMEPCPCTCTCMCHFTCRCTACTCGSDLGSATRCRACADWGGGACSAVVDVGRVGGGCQCAYHLHGHHWRPLHHRQPPL